MIERQQELKRRYHRKAKMTKLKAKLGTTTGDARTAVLAKIHRLSPAWTEASLRAPDPVPEPAPADEKKRPAPKAKK